MTSNMTSLQMGMINLSQDLSKPPDSGCINKSGFQISSQTFFCNGKFSEFYSRDDGLIKFTD